MKTLEKTLLYPDTEKKKPTPWANVLKHFLIRVLLRSKTLRENLQNRFIHNVILKETSREKL